VNCPESHQKGKQKQRGDDAGSKPVNWVDKTLYLANEVDVGNV
jgi:hypothetical protein